MRDASRRSLPSQKSVCAKLERDIQHLFKNVISNAYITNCDSAASVIKGNAKVFAGALLFAFGRSKKVPLRSLSYIFADKKFHSFPEGQLTSKSMDADLKKSIIDKSVRWIEINNKNSHCLFAVANDFTSTAVLKQVQLLSLLYNYMVFASHNYKNYVSAHVYYHAKPSDTNAYYPRFEGVESVCQTLSEIYDVRARHFIYLGSRNPTKLKLNDDFSAYNREKISKYCRQQSLSRQFIQHIRSAVTVRQSRIGRLQNQKGNFYAVFPVYDPNIRGSDTPPDGIVILLSRKPLGLFVMSAAEAWLAAFSSKRHIQKASVLSNCLEKAEREILRIGAEATLQDRLSCFDHIAQELCKEICACTTAASVSVRIIDRIHGNLTKIAGHQSNWGGYYDTILQKKRDKKIPMQMTDSSFNAFAAVYGGKEKVLHIEDIDAIPEEYRNNGLRQVLRHHKFTRTEAVARVVAGRSCVALMNIEAPVSGSLRHHLQFFAECADFLGELYRRLFSLTDSSGLAAMAKSQVEIHSVADLLREWKDGDSKGAILIVRRLRQLRRRPIDQAATDVREISFPRGPEIGAEVGNFNTGLKNWVNYLLAARGYAQLEAKSIIKGCVPKHFDPSLIPSLFVITMSIMENILLKPTLTKNTVTFKDELTGFPLARRLTIEWICRVPLEPGVDRNSILLKPLVDASGNSHFGFFLVGVHARQHGGTTELIDTYDDRDLPAGFTLTVSLPYGPAELHSTHHLVAAQ